MNKRLFVLGAAGVLAAAGILFAATSRLSSHPDRKAMEAAHPVPVQLVRAEIEDLAESFEIGGDVRARDTATLVSRIVAPITQVLVKPGDRVRAGQVLVLLDARDLTAAHDRAQAALASAQEGTNAAAAGRRAAEAALFLARATYNRISELRAKNSATPNELDQAQEGLQAAEARLAGADAQIAQAAAGVREAEAASEGSSITRSYATVTAPFEGVVTQKLTEAGNMAAPGVPLLTVEDTRAFRLEVRVDQSRTPLVSVGQPVQVAIDEGSVAPGRWVTGRVAEIAQVLDSMAHALVAKIDLPPVDGLRSGMFGRARFAGPTRRALAIPAASVVRRGQLTSVFVVDRSGIARLRLVSLAEPGDAVVEVRAGVDPGETVITDPPPGLVDGTPVTATRTTTQGAPPSGGRA